MIRRIPPLTTRLTFTLLLLIAGGSSARAQQAPAMCVAQAPALLVRIDGAPVHIQVVHTK